MANKKMNKFIKLLKSPSMVAAHLKLLDEAGGKPEKIAEILRKKAWGKRSIDGIIEEMEKNQTKHEKCDIEDRFSRFKRFIRKKRITTPGLTIVSALILEFEEVDG
jgi:hypothetical protein